MLKIFFFFLLCICSILASAPWLNEDKPNSTLTEGDIAFEDAPDSNEQRSAIEDDQVHASESSPRNRKWENNIVPYTLSRDFTTDQRSTILAAMTEINRKTCISFVGRVQEKDFILFRKVPDRSLCSSLLGREGGRQHVNLTNKCVVRNTVLHELMHVLGFQHEHSRHDRDKNIQINLSHVKREYKQHLEPIRKVDPLDSLVRYDHKSITHYSKDAFSAYRNKKTIISKVRGVKVKSDGLSEIDIWKINYMYNCSNEGESVESSNEHEEETTTNIPNIYTTADQQRTTNQLSAIQSTIKQVQTRNSTTIRKTSIGTTLKMTTSTTTRPTSTTTRPTSTAIRSISILNAEIIDAVKEGNEDKVRILLNEGADVNAKDTFNWTPLLHAASKVNVNKNVVSLLLDKGANIEARTISSWTPLHFAARNGHVNIVSLLLDKGANIEAKDDTNWTPLHWGARHGHVNVVSLLLDKDANIEARTTSNYTPLHLAAMNGDVNVVSLLLDKGASIEARTTSNYTPLHYAAMNGDVNVVSLLLDKGANIEARNTDNDTPLHWAAYNGDVNVVSLLLDKGANIFAKGRWNNVDSTPLDLAKRGNKTEIVEILERKQRQLITG